MPIEIERKFLANPSVLEQCPSGIDIVQGYLFTDPDNTVRVRRLGEHYFVAWKGKRRGACREEVEQAVAPEIGAMLLGTISPRDRIEKTRHRIAIGPHVWEVDRFAGALSGLILAEVELTREDEAVDLPAWIEREVTADERYRNSRLLAGSLRHLSLAA